MDRDENEVVVPVISEQLHVDAEPVETGGVRVVKRVVGHDEVVEQQLRQTRSEVKRVRVNRVVDGPQPVRKLGNTVIVPVVSETLIVQKQWVLTEEIHIEQNEELETVRQNVTLNHEEASIERFDETGQTTSVMQPQTVEESPSPLIQEELPAETDDSVVSSPRSPLTSRQQAETQRRGPRSILRNRSGKG